MTNLEALKLKLKISGLTEDDYKLMLIDSGFNPDDEYKPSEDFDYVIFMGIITTLSEGVKNRAVKEGGFSVSETLDYESLYGYLNKLSDDWGWYNPYDTRGQIKNATTRW